MRVTLLRTVNSRKGREADVAPEDFGDFLTDPGGDELLFILSGFSEGRTAAKWECADGIAIDIDLKRKSVVGTSDPFGTGATVTHKAEAAPYAGRLADAWEADIIDGSAMYVTPHGVRVVFIGNEPITDKRTFQLVAADLLDKTREAVATVLASEVEAGLVVRGDECSLKPTQPMYLPCITVPARGAAEEDEVREATVLTHEGRTFALAPRDLSMEVPEEAPTSPPPPPPPPPPAAPPPEAPPAWTASTDVDEAKEAFNRHADHILRWYVDSNPAGYCPACSAVKGADAKEGRLKPFLVNDVPEPGRWVCRGDSHGEANPPLGVKGVGCYVGDLLDLVAWDTGTGHLDVLLNTGFLVEAPPEEAPEAKPAKPSEDGRVDVHIPNAEEGITVKEYGTAVLDACRTDLGPVFYRYGGNVAMVSRATDGDLSIITATGGNAGMVAARAERHVRLINTVTRSKKRVHVPVTPGRLQGAQLVDAIGANHLAPPLESVVTFPCLLPSGGLSEPGYNPMGAVYYDEPADLRGLVADTKGKPAARRKVLDDYLADTAKVVGPHGVATLVSIMVTAIIRAGVRLKAPAFGFLSNQPGSGKSTAGEDIIGACIYGAAPEPITESLATRKGMDSFNHQVAQSPHPVLFFDNTKNDSRVDSAELASKVTSAKIACGRLAYAHNVTSVRNRFVFIINGNRLEFDKDLATRVVPVRFLIPEGFGGFTTPDTLAHALDNRRRVLSTLLGAILQASSKYGGNLAVWPGKSGDAATWGHIGRWQEWYKVVGTVMDLLGYPEWLVLPEADTKVDDGETEFLVSLVYEVKRAAKSPVKDAGIKVTFKDGATVVGFNARALAASLPDEVMSALPGALHATPNVRLGHAIAAMVDNRELPVRVIRGGLRRGYRQWDMRFPTNVWEEE